MIRIRIIVVCLAIIFSQSAFANDRYKYLAAGEYGATFSHNHALYKQRLYVLNSNGVIEKSTAIDVYQTDSITPRQKPRRITLELPANGIQIGGDLLLARYDDSIAVMRLTDTGESIIGQIKTTTTNGYYTTYVGPDNTIVIQEYAGDDSCNVYIYDVNSTVTLRKKLNYASIAPFNGLYMDDRYIYAFDFISYDNDDIALTTISLDDYSLKSKKITPTVYAAVRPRGKYIAIHFNNVSNPTQIYELANGEMQLNRSMNVHHSDFATINSNHFYYKKPKLSELCRQHLSNNQTEECYITPNIQAMKSFSASGDNVIYTTENEFHLYNIALKQASSIPASPNVIQLAVVNNNLVARSDDSTYFLDKNDYSFHKTSSEGVAPEYNREFLGNVYTDKKTIKVKYTWPNKPVVEIYSAADQQQTLTDSFEIDRTLHGFNDSTIAFSDKYFIHLDDDLAVFDLENRGKLIKIFPREQLKTPWPHNPLPNNNAYLKLGLHAENITFHYNNELYILPISVSDEYPIRKISDVHSFNYYAGTLFTSFENNIRQFQQNNAGNYSEIATFKDAECGPSMVPASLNVSDNKLLLLKRRNLKTAPGERDILCVYAMDKNALSLAAKLQLPSMSTEQIAERYFRPRPSLRSHFTTLGNHLYGNVEGDGRLLHFKLNLAPTFPNTVSIKEDSQNPQLVAVQDEENDVVLLELTKAPTQGKASIVNNQISYNPNANYHGIDLLRLKATDSVGNSTEQVVQITVTPVNDAPLAEPFQFSTTVSQSYSAQLKASDIDGDTLSFSLVSAPKLGTVTINANGSFSYQANSSGSDSFSYKVSDGQGGEQQALVSIVVNADNSGGGTTPTTTPGAVASSGGGVGAAQLMLLVLLALRRKARQLH